MLRLRDVVDTAYFAYESVIGNDPAVSWVEVVFSLADRFVGRDHEGALVKVC